MGRAFEYRKKAKFARWGAMARNFTKVGREIALAVKDGGADPATNPRLRTAMQNAKGFNMPKDRVEAAIKRASSKEEGDFEEIVYEGYGSHGVPIVVECATNNSNRTVAMIRMHFSRCGGALGKTGSLEFMFDRTGVFELEASKIDMDELELEFIDAGAEDISTQTIEVEEGVEQEIIVIHTKFEDFGQMQKFLDSKGIEPRKSNIQRIPKTTQKLTDDQEEDVMKLIDRLEEEDDILAIYHNLE